MQYTTYVVPFVPERPGLRHAIFARDGYKCHQCGGFARHVHRKVCIPCGGTYTPENLVSLCHICHLVVHRQLGCCP
jgi:5-methylcytosine-specific restriction endonuclease McrA